MFYGLYDPLLFSSFICMPCIVLLLIESAMIVRILFIARKPLFHYVSLLFPLAVCIQASIILVAAQNVPQTTSIHPTPWFYHLVQNAVNRGIMLCQWQIALMVVVFIAMFIIERRFLPHVKQPPAWVSARMMQMMR